MQNNSRNIREIDFKVISRNVCTCGILSKNPCFLSKEPSGCLTGFRLNVGFSNLQISVVVYRLAILHNSFFIQRGKQLVFC